MSAWVHQLNKVTIMDRTSHQEFPATSILQVWNKANLVFHIWDLQRRQCKALAEVWKSQRVRTVIIICSHRQDLDQRQSSHRHMELIHLWPQEVEDNKLVGIITLDKCVRPNKLLPVTRDLLKSLKVLVQNRFKEATKWSKLVAWNMLVQVLWPRQTNKTFCLIITQWLFAIVILCQQFRKVHRPQSKS